jgi:type II secretory pathway pseudopilin PulG
MFKFAILALTVVICIVSLSCQEYSTDLQKSVARADETAAMSALHTIALAQQTYAATNGGAFGTFEQLSDGGYLDSRFNSSKPTIKDYVLKMDVTPKSEAQPAGFYSCNADPVRPESQPGRHFYIDSTSTRLHVNPDEPATVKDPIVNP